MGIYRSFQIFSFFIEYQKIKDLFSRQDTATKTIEKSTYDFKLKFSNSENGMLQARIDKKYVEDDTLVETSTCHIFFDDENSRIVVAGKKDFRRIVIEGLISLISKESITKHFEEISLSKESCDALLTKLKKSRKKNFCFNPRFVFPAKGFGKDHLAFDGFSIANDRCATDKSDYNKMYDAAVYMEPIYKLYYCPGIVEAEIKNPIQLKLSHNGTFSSYLDKTEIEWFRFYNEICSQVEF